MIEDVVVLLHGIRTQAEWQESVAATVRVPDRVEVVPLRIGFFDVIRFLLPLRSVRSAVAARIAGEVRAIRNLYPRARISVVAHSFGTFVLTLLLEEHPDLQFHRAILCGSVVRRDFRWASFAHRFYAEPAGGPAVVNDCGYRDVWPVLAETLSWGYGASGRFGFGAAGVRDRFHPLRHSDFFADDFVNAHWKPYLLAGTVTEGTLDRPTAPWILSVLPVLPMKTLFLAVAVVATVSSFSWRDALSEIDPPLVDCVRQDCTCEVVITIRNEMARDLLIRELVLNVKEYEEHSTLGGPLLPTQVAQLDFNNLRSSGAIGRKVLVYRLSAGEVDKLSFSISATALTPGVFGRWIVAPRLETTEGRAELQPWNLELPWKREEVSSQERECHSSELTGGTP